MHFPGLCHNFSKTLDENLAELSKSSESTNFNYDENKRKLAEISKIVFPHLSGYSLIRQKQIFFAFAPYGMLDPLAYKTIEKNLIKSFHNNMDFQEVVKFLKCLAISKNLHVSPSIFLLIEQKINKNLATMSNEQFLSILQSYEQFNSQENHRIYKVLSSFFVNKSPKMSLLLKLKAMILLIQSKQCNVRLMLEAAEAVFGSFMQSLPNLQLNHFVLTYLLYFSAFLQKNLMDPKILENHKKFQIKDNINQILLSGVLGYKENSIEKDILNSFLSDPKKNYEKNHQKIEKKLNDILITQQKSVKINDIFVFLDSFAFLERKIPEGFEEKAREFVKDNILKLTPNEIFKITDLANDKKLNSSENFKEFLFKNVYLYFENFLQEFSIVELCNIWKIVDFYSLGRIFD